MLHITEQLSAVDKAGFVIFDRNSGNIRVLDWKRGKISTRQIDIEDYYDKGVDATYSSGDQKGYEEMVDLMNGKGVNLWASTINKLINAEIGVAERAGVNEIKEILLKHEWPEGEPKGCNLVEHSVVLKLILDFIDSTDKVYNPDVEKQLTNEQFEAFYSDFHKALTEGKYPYLWKKYRSGLITQDVVDQIEPWRGRTYYHLDRLLLPNRSPKENTFARDFISYAGSVGKPLEEVDDQQSFRNIRNILQHESSATCLWWTLSPYIHEILSSKVGSEKSIELLLRWADVDEHEFDQNLGNVPLEGLDRYNQLGNSNAFVLGDDPNGFSHQFAKKEAGRLVKEVFERKIK